MPKAVLRRLDVDDINRALDMLSEDIEASSEGLDRFLRGKQPLKGDIDLGNFCVTNAGTSESDDDYVTRGELEERIDDIEEANIELETSAADEGGGGAKGRRLRRRTSRLRTIVEDEIQAAVEGAVPTAAPPEVEDAGAVGTTDDTPGPLLFALSDHTHSGMNLSDNQTAVGIKTFSGTMAVTGTTQLTETGDPQLLTLGAVADGEVFTRVGTTIVGGGLGTNLGHIDIVSDVLTGGEPTSTFTLSNTPIAGTEVLSMNGVRQRRVAAAPGVNEYTITGSLVTLGLTKGAGDFLVADYRVPPNTRRIYHEEHVGTGTAFTLANTPVIDTEVLNFNTLRLRKVGAAPGINEYTISGAAITLGFSKVAGDYFIADYDALTAAAAHTHIYNEELTGTGTAFTLANVPVAGSEILWFNTLRQRRVVAGPGINEYTISGADVTTGLTKVASDGLVADYTF